jgi:hypothetical protein
MLSDEESSISSHRLKSGKSGKVVEGIPGCMTIMILCLSLGRSRKGLDNVGDRCYFIHSLVQEVRE